LPRTRHLGPAHHGILTGRDTCDTNRAAHPGVLRDEPSQQLWEPELGPVNAIEIGRDRRRLVRAKEKNVAVPSTTPPPPARSAWKRARMSRSRESAVPVFHASILRSCSSAASSSA